LYPGKFQVKHQELPWGGRPTVEADPDAAGVYPARHPTSDFQKQLDKKKLHGMAGENSRWGSNANDNQMVIWFPDR
jgi:hypothetical protein